MLQTRQQGTPRIVELYEKQGEGELTEILSIRGAPVKKSTYHWIVQNLKRSNPELATFNDSNSTLSYLVEAIRHNLALPGVRREGCAYELVIRQPV